MRSFMEQYFWVPWAGAAVVLCCICGLFVLIHFHCVHLRRQRAKQLAQLQEQVMGPGDARLHRF
jgi:hypothetical protein